MSYLHHGRPKRPRPPRHNAYRRRGPDQSAGNIAGAVIGIAAIAGIAEVAKNLREKTEEQTGNRFVPPPKTIGGATTVYLPIIQQDFPDFHNPNAESDIKSVIRDYILCVHGEEIVFDKEDTSRNVVNNIVPKQQGNVTDLLFHQIAISNYQKTLDYATITYKMSLGYKLSGLPIETRYEVHYTLQLREDGRASKAMCCRNCNAPISELTHQTVCSYCEAKIFRDTILDWVVSDIKELP